MKPADPNPATVGAPPARPRRRSRWTLLALRSARAIAVALVAIGVALFVGAPLFGPVGAAGDGAPPVAIRR